MISVLKYKCNAPDQLLQGKSKHVLRYTEKMKEFSLTLYFYSPKAYKFLRKKVFCLLNPSTLRSWISKFNCLPGFFNEVFMFLKTNVQTKDFFKNVNLTFDCMSIRKQLIYDQRTGKM